VRSEGHDDPQTRRGNLEGRASARGPHNHPASCRVGDTGLAHPIANSLELRLGEIHAGVEVCIAPPHSARTASEVCSYSRVLCAGVRGHKRSHGA
jgi:hypothetical protein